MDLDLVADGTGEVLVGGVLEHIEEAGIHSGDAACDAASALALPGPGGADEGPGDRRWPASWAWSG